MRERFKVIPAVYVIFEKGDQVLLLRRCNTGFKDGFYSLVAGHVDGGESLKQAAVREVAEEAGVIITEDDLELVHMLHRPAYKDPGQERFDIFFKVHNWNGEPKNMEPHKCDDLSWFAKDNLPENMVNYVVHVFEQIAQGIRYSDLGF